MRRKSEQRGGLQSIIQKKMNQMMILMGAASKKQILMKEIHF